MKYPNIRSTNLGRPTSRPCDTSDTPKDEIVCISVKQKVNSGRYH